MGWIADLLKEIPSAARYKSELETMERENVQLKTQIQVCQSEVADLRQEIQRRDDIIQKEKSHDNLPDEQMEVLTLLAKSGLTEEKIIDAINRNPESIRFDLEELKRAGIIENDKVASMAGITLYSLTHDGRRYLKKLGII